MSLLGRVGLLIRRELSTRLAASAGRTGHGQGSPQSREAGPEETGAVAPPPPIPVQDPTLAALYANLELPYGADVNAVREARRRLLRRYHPDLYSLDPETRRTATQVAQGLNHAHDELVDRLSRKQQ